MKLILRRKDVHADTTDGTLHIELARRGCNIVERLCDTAEHTPTMLPTGEYAVTIAFDARFDRKMPMIRLTNAGQTVGVLRFGNGVYTLRDGSIIVGEHRCPGLCIKSKQTFDRIYDRMQKASQRNEQITLTIE